MKTLSLAIFVLLVAASTHERAGAADLILLDNTNGLDTSTLSGSSSTGFGTNSTAYNRINGYTFQVGSTSYDATSVSISLRWNGGGTITPTIRLQIWELPNLIATTPAGSASPFYSEDFTGNVFGATNEYVTFDLTGDSVNLKADTRYSIGFLTDQTTISSFLIWQGYNPVGSKPSGSYGLDSLSGGSGFASVDAGSSFSTSTMVMSFRMTGVAVVPEPSAFAMACTGISVIVLAVRRTRVSLRNQ